MGHSSYFSTSHTRAELELCGRPFTISSLHDCVKAGQLRIFTPRTRLANALNATRNRRALSVGLPEAKTLDVYAR